MIEAYLLDTNIVSAYLKFPKLVDSPPPNAEQMTRVRDRVSCLASPVFSALTVWEIERGLAKNAMHRHLRSFRSFCLHSTVLAVDDAVLKAAVGVWGAAAKAGMRPGDVDALLVATAQHWGHTFVSCDNNALTCAAVQTPPIPTCNWFEI